MRPVFDPTGGPDVLVEKMIGQAYATVKRVYCHLPEIKRLDAVLTEIPTLAQTTADNALAAALPPILDQLDGKVQAAEGWAGESEASAEAAAQSALMLGSLIQTVERATELHQDLAATGGAALVGYKGRTVAQRLSDTVSVKDFGATGDGVTDDTAAILSAVAALSNPSRNVLYFPYGSYRTSVTIEVPPGANTWCAPGVVFQRFGAAPKNFPCFVINGGGREHYIGLIDAYGDGIVVRGSANRVRFQRISNCTRGLVISAISASNLDNKIDGVQIGLSTDAIVFEQSGKRTQQGNEIRVNFVSESLNTLVFDDLGTHTENSDWDSNFVELMASDPFYKAGATLAYNKSAFGVRNLHYIIKSWAGGWNYNDGTITVIQGGFATCQFEFSFAAQLSPQSMLGPTLRTGYGGCQVKLLRNQNLGTNTAFTAVTSGSIDTFNGGIALNVKRFRIACTVPALAVGQSAVRVFSHVLCQSSYGGKFKIASVEANSHPYIINIREMGTTTVGMVGIGFQNPSAATIPETTLNLIIEAGD